MTDKKTKKHSYLTFLSNSLTNRGQNSSPLSVEDLVGACRVLDFRIEAGGKGLGRKIITPKIHALGLALAGFTDDLEPGSVQFLGKSEMRFIREKIEEEPPDFFDPEFESDIGCFVVAEGLPVPGVFLKKADQFQIPVLWSSKSRQTVEAKVGEVLEAALAPSFSFHGDLVVVCGLGVLILGESGIGKSDCALDLVTHGHQLVADDIIHVRRNPLGQLIGRSRDLIRHHLDVRGLGIVNIKELFSVNSVIEQHAIDLVIFLEPWDATSSHSCEREEEVLDILGVEKRLVRLRVTSGRNWTNLIQVAVRNFILKSDGYDAEKALAERLDRLLDTTEKSGPSSEDEKVD